MCNLVKCHTCYDLPHRLSVACPSCGLEPGPAPFVESEVYGASSLGWMMDDQEEAAVRFDRWKAQEMKTCKFCLREFRAESSIEVYCSAGCASAMVDWEADEAMLEARGHEKVRTDEVQLGCEGTCKQCGGRFMKLKPAQSLCSERCKTERRRMRDRSRWHKSQAKRSEKERNNA